MSLLSFSGFLAAQRKTALKDLFCVSTCHMVPFAPDNFVNGASMWERFGYTAPKKERSCLAGVGRSMARIASIFLRQGLRP